jgi:hypothetical protein
MWVIPSDKNTDLLDQASVSLSCCKSQLKSRENPEKEL